MSGRLALIFSAALVLVLMSGCWRSQPGAAAVNVQTAQPKRGPIARKITLPAEVAPYQQATLYAKVAGYLKSISVDKGDVVKQGDLLAEIEVPELLADKAKFAAEVQVAEIDYKRVQNAQKKAPDLVVPQTVDDAKRRIDQGWQFLAIGSELRFRKETTPCSVSPKSRLRFPE